jgi:hypothetical protein
MPAAQYFKLANKLYQNQRATFYFDAPKTICVICVICGKKSLRKQRIYGKESVAERSEGLYSSLT